MTKTTKRRAGAMRSVQAEQVARRESATRAVYEIARREAAGKSNETDGNVLGGALSQAGISDTEYADMVTICERHAKLAGSVDDEQAIVALASARRAVKEHDAKMRQLRDAEPPLVAAFNRAQHELGAIHKARDDLAELEFGHADLLGLKTHDDLDQFTLHCRGAVLNVYDPDAPTLTVTPAVFDEQSRRRHGILAAARVREHERYGVAFRAWERALPRAHSGRPMDDGRGPKRSEPTWRDIAQLSRAERDELAGSVS